MSQLEAASFAAAATKIVHQVADARRAQQREPGQPVHRLAVDYLDLEARRPRRLSPGSYEDELDHHRAARDVVRAWQAQSVATGPHRYRGVFGVHGVAILDAILNDMARSGDGRSDLAYSQLAAAIGQATSTVYHRYHALIAAGVIDYQPRSIAAGVDGRGKFLRVQMSSIAWLTPDRLPPEWRELFKRRLAHHRERRQEQARRREAAARRQMAKERMQDLCAAKAEKAREGGTPPRQRPVRTFDPFKVNPAASLHLVDQDAKRTQAARDEEQRQAEWVAANLAEAQERARAQWR